MKKLTMKQSERMEKKKKKMSAFLEIARLNDKDKEAKLQALKQAAIVTDRTSGFTEESDMVETNLNCKRSHMKDSDICPVPDKNAENLDATTAALEESESQPHKKPKLSHDDYRKLKQELKERKKRLGAIPRLTLKVGGENAILNVEKPGDRIPIFLSDVQHLLLFSLLGHHSPYLPTRWCKLEKYNKVSHTVVFVIEGLSLHHFMAHKSTFSHITNNMTHHLEVVTPTIYGASITEELLAVPLTGTQSDKLIKQYGSLETALQTTGDVIKLLRTTFPVRMTSDDVGKEKICENLPSTDKFCRTKLLLSLWQMVEENFPVPLKGTLVERYGSYVLTNDSYDEATATSPMFALDCEMCQTTSSNLELARITVVDEGMNIIYDSLVKPENEITNYLTQYSGITKEMLDDVTVRLHDVQQTLRTLLPSDAILVGQSLNFDLHTLKMMHPYIIDTSVIFNISGQRYWLISPNTNTKKLYIEFSHRYRKSKLQTLAREFLGETIQTSKAGHCSAEDSKASMKLVQLKLANSVDYGDAVLLGDCNIEVLKTQDREKMSQRAWQKHRETKKYAMSLFSHITKDKNTAAIVGNNEVMSEYSKYLKSSSLNIMDDENFAKDDKVRLVIAENDKHAVHRTCEIAMEHGFVLCHTKLEEEQLEDQEIEKTLHTVNKWIGKLWQHTAINGLSCVLFGGQSDTGNGACFLNIKKDILPIIRA